MIDELHIKHLWYAIEELKEMRNNGAEEHTKIYNDIIGDASALKELLITLCKDKDSLAPAYNRYRSKRGAACYD